MFDSLFEKLEESLDWDYSFMYGHDQIIHNPMVDREDNPVYWQTRPTLLKGKRIRVFTDYQEKWARNQNAIPVRELGRESNEKLIPRCLEGC